MNLTRNKFLTDDELKQLKWNLKHERNQFHILLVEFALYTGARSAEIVEVVKEDLSKGTVTIYGKKNSNDRTILLPPAFFKRLETYVKTLENGRKLFPITTRAFRKIWCKVTPNRAKTLHSLRHTMGVKLYNNCSDIHVVRTILGHKSISNTMCYLEYVDSIKKQKQSIAGMWNKKLDNVA